MTKVVKTFLVTGASSGIGLAVSQALLKEGYAVVGISRSVRENCINHQRFTALACDLLDFGKVEVQLKERLKRNGSIDGAVFCAGQGYFGGLEQLDFVKIEKLIKLNLLSPMLICKMLIPYLKTRKAGRLVFIGSEAALQGAKNGTAYCASKFGLRGFVQSLSAECRPAGITVSLINPGMVNTPFFNDLSFQPGDHPSNAILAETVAASVLNCISSAPNSVIDEINLSPRNKVVTFKPASKKDY